MVYQTRELSRRRARDRERERKSGGKKRCHWCSLSSDISAKRDKLMENCLYAFTQYWLLSQSLLVHISVATYKTLMEGKANQTEQQLNH